MLEGYVLADGYYEYTEAGLGGFFKDSIVGNYLILRTTRRR